jgi:hypothetical protein
MTHIYREIDIIHIHTGVLLSHEEAQNHVICRRMNGTGEHHVKQNKPDSKTIFLS